MTWDINQMHRVFNHAGEEALCKTAKVYGWKITGKMAHCRDCYLSNTRQKGVSKETKTKSDSPVERIYIDITSAKTPSLGGNKFLLGVIDDKTDFVWVKPLKRKKDQVKTMKKFFD